MYVNKWFFGIFLMYLLFWMRVVIIHIWRGFLLDLDHFVITEVATNKRLFSIKLVVCPPSVFLHHGVANPEVWWNSG